MSEPAEDLIVHNLIDALERLRDDLNKVELWAAALGHFQHPVPDYQPGSAYMLSSSSEPASCCPRHLSQRRRVRAYKRLIRHPQTGS